MSKARLAGCSLCSRSRIRQQPHFLQLPGTVHPETGRPSRGQHLPTASLGRPDRDKSQDGASSPCIYADGRTALFRTSPSEPAARDDDASAMSDQATKEGRAWQQNIAVIAPSNAPSLLRPHSPSRRGRRVRYAVSTTLHGLSLPRKKASRSSSQCRPDDSHAVCCPQTSAFGHLLETLSGPHSGVVEPGWQGGDSQRPSCSLGRDHAWRTSALVPPFGGAFTTHSQADNDTNANRAIKWETVTELPHTL